MIKTATIACPIDGMRIPLVALTKSNDDHLSYHWCWSCGELFACIDNPRHDIAGFSWDSTSNNWILCHSFGMPDEIKIAVAGLVEVGPPSQFDVT